MKKRLLLLLMFVALCTHLMAQTRSVSGKVTDDKGNALPNASVIVKGTTTGVTTGPDGSFSISVSSSARALIVSYVGMVDKEIELTGNRASYNVSLSATAKNDMQEVVVVAYGTQQRKEITGSSSVVKSSQIANVPRSSVDQILQGKVAGLQSATPSGQPGSIQQLRIRGIGSISAGAAPLWVVDGVPLNIGDFSRLSATSNTLAGINPNDIENVTVLKDAAATSIYGSRAANGVILVTTKKGRPGKARIKAEMEIGGTDVANLPEAGRPLNAAEWLMLTEEGLKNAGATQAQITTLLNSYGATTGVDTDWWNLVTRRGTQAQFNLSASGGNERTTYFISGGYFKQQAPVIASDLERFSGTVNLTNKFSDRITVSNNLAISSYNQNTPSSGGAFANPIDAVYFLRPTQNPYNPDGSYNINRIGNTNFPADFNPLYLAENDKKLLNNFKILGNITGEARILKDLKFTSRFGVDYFNLIEDRYDNPFHGDGRNAFGRSWFSYTKMFNWIFTNQLDYRLDVWNNNISIDAKVGYEAQLSKETDRDARKENFPPSLDLTNPSVGATPASFTGTQTDYAFESIFSKLGLNYRGKYVLSGTLRRDGSSRFGINNRYGTFWSVGAAWNIDQEDFMKNIRFISSAKIRGSYGVNGNGDLANYAWRPLYSYGANYNGQPGGVFNNIGNVDLTWELNKPFNIGADLAFFNSRLSLSFDYYKRETSDLLLDRPLSRTTGFTTIAQNVGAMENKGVEVTLEGTPIRAKDFTWDASFNFSHNKNRITKLPGGDILSSAFIRREGYDIQSFYVREWAGVDPATGNPQWYVDNTKATKTTTYTAAQRYPFGSASPKFFGSLGNTLTFKGFSVDVQFYYNFGNYVRDSWAGSLLDGVLPSANKYRINLNRWQKAGDVTDVPRYVYNLQNNASAFSTRVLYKGDFIRLQNLTVSYNLPKTLLSRAGITSAMFYVRGFNLFTKTYDDRLTFDPENGIQNQANLTIPLSKTVTVGLNFEF